jgi:hypothetical protein
MKFDKVLTSTVSPAMWKYVHDEAKRRDQSVAGFVRTILRQWMERQCDAQSDKGERQ